MNTVKQTLFLTKSTKWRPEGGTLSVVPAIQTCSKLILVSLLLLLSYQMQAQRLRNLPAEKPSLVVWLVVDQMRYDYISRFNHNFSEGGFNRLIGEGTLCTNAQFNYIFNQPGVGEATLITGSDPETHGIVSEYWYKRLQEQEIHCTADDRFVSVGTTNNHGQRSPQALSASTLGDEMKLSNELKSKVFSVALEPSSSIVMGGHTADAAYWFDQETGNWITSNYYTDSLKTWIREFNEKKINETYLEKQWNLLLSTEKYLGCMPDKNDYETGILSEKTFPYDLYDISNLKKRKPNYGVLKFVPYGNNFTKDFAISLIVNENLGKGEYTDMISVGFNSSQEIGLRFGPRSLEVQDNFLRLDRELEHFLSFLDDFVGKEKVLVILTSNYGLADIPQYLSDVKIPADYFNSKSTMQLLKSYLNATYGKGKWVQYYYKQQVFLNRELIEDSDLDIRDVQQKAADFLLQFSGIANTVTATTLQTTNFTDGMFEKMQNSYNQERSGDILINLKPGWVELSNRSTDTNTGYTYCTHVPLVFYGWKVGRGRIHDKISMADVAPTISALLEIASPNSATGSVIKDIIK